ncbi:MAG: hypothetical protein M3Q47_05930 [Actinomycetota bacterium]|nr:hypothetical protein [Actinomycetota bacterium]
MSAPTTITTRPSTGTEQSPADDGLGLLLDLFALELPAEAPAPWRRPADGRRPVLRARVQEWLRRAALWGAGPQGAWRAW